MISRELDLLYKSLEQAVKAEDLFGVPLDVSLDDKQGLTEVVKEIYRRLAKTAHPDHHEDGEARELANEVFAELNGFYQKALKKIELGSYGRGFSDESAEEGDADFLITTPKRQYHINKTLAQGDLSTVYSGFCSGGDEGAGEVALKVVEDPADNDLMQNETRILKLFAAESSIYSKHLPTLLDEFKTSEGQLGTIMRKIKGFDLFSIRQKYTEGIPQRHIVWIFRRCLSAIGYAHSKGVIHGNLEPSHILVSPHDHNVFLIDWCYSIYKPGPTGQGFKCLNEDYSPPEVGLGKPPIPASDLYSLAKCMVFLLGGDIKTNCLPDTVEDKLKRFILFFLRESPIQRAQDAWQMYGELDILRKELFGPHKFLEFKM